jgi:hypothetical protein
MAEQEFRGSLGAHKDFAESVVWLDYQQELLAWLDSIRDQLEIEQDMHTITHLQGVAEACHKFLALPNNIIEILSIVRESDDGTE